MGSGAESAASAASDTGSTVGQVANVAGNTASNTGGFALNAAPSMGPTVDAASNIGNTAQSIGPSYLQADSPMYSATDYTQVPQGSMISRFMQGQNQDLGQAYENFGNNPETYGYLFNKVYTVGRGLSGGGGQQQAAPITINTNYQQETDNPYLRKYRRY